MRGQKTQTTKRNYESDWLLFCFCAAHVIRGSRTKTTAKQPSHPTNPANPTNNRTSNPINKPTHKQTNQPALQSTRQQTALGLSQFVSWLVILFVLSKSWLVACLLDCLLDSVVTLLLAVVRLFAGFCIRGMLLRFACSFAGAFVQLVGGCKWQGNCTVCASGSSAACKRL